MFQFIVCLGVNILVKYIFLATPFVKDDILFFFRNIELKKTLGDMEIQLKVLKQLMLETGMAKYMP